MKVFSPIRAACRLAAALLFLCLPAAEAEWRGGTVLEFAGGRVICIVAEDGGGDLAAAADIGMASALRLLPPPDERATVTVRLLAPPPFYKRWLGGGAAAPHGYQSGGEIAVRPESDRVKLAFRLGHEMAHWLVARTHPQRPPLWLDEGLAQLVGARAAAAAGRTEKRGLARTPPDGWEAAALSLDALAAATAYGGSPAAAGAFYWQAERLVDALLARLGRDDFLEYLSLLSAPGAPPWQEPLRARWWFNDADFDALARAIDPTQPTAP